MKQMHRREEGALPIDKAAAATAWYGIVRGYRRQVHRASRNIHVRMFDCF